MVESSGIVSLEVMKLGKTDDVIQSNSSQNTDKSHQLLDLHIDQYNDISANSSQQTSTNNISDLCMPSDHMTLNLEDRRSSQRRSYVSCPVKSPKFGHDSFNQKLSCSKNVDISCSLPSFPLVQSFGLKKIIPSKSTSNFEFTKQCHNDT